MLVYTIILLYTYMCMITMYINNNIFNFKNKYDEYDRLLKWLIHFCYNLWLLTY